MFCRKDIAVLTFRGFETDGKRPRLGSVSLDVGVEEETLLRYGNARVLNRTEGENWDAGLRDKAVHDFIDRLVTHFGERVPEILGSSVAI